MFCERHVELASAGRAREGAPTPHFARDVDEDDLGLSGRERERERGIGIGRDALGVERTQGQMSRGEKRQTRFLNLNVI